MGHRTGSSITSHLLRTGGLSTCKVVGGATMKLIACAGPKVAWAAALSCHQHGLPKQTVSTHLQTGLYVCTTCINTRPATRVHNLYQHASSNSVSFRDSRNVLRSRILAGRWHPSNFHSFLIILMLIQRRMPTATISECRTSMEHLSLVTEMLRGQ